MEEKKLFAVYLGGSAERSSIEVHDVVFVVGPTLEETYPLLSKKWFGNRNKVHIDSYMHLQCVDGYEIQLVKECPAADSLKKLYFINLGAYKEGEFTEYHQNAFYVAESPPEAIRRAKSELCLGLQTVHKDDVVVLDRVNNGLEYDVDDVLEIRSVDEYFISLVPTTSSEKPYATSAYIKLEAYAEHQ